MKTPARTSTRKCGGDTVVARGILRNEDPAAYGSADSDSRPSKSRGDRPGCITAEEKAVIAQAESILSRHFLRHGIVNDKNSAGQWLRMKLATSDHEIFGILMLDNLHRVIDMEILFRGTIEACAISYRDIARLVIERQAAAVILFHNHPSGSSIPSAADKILTHDIGRLLGMLECRVLDHLILGEDITSFRSTGLLN